VRRGPTPPARAIPILRGVCAALAEAHARGIIHRDLKPQNILLTSTTTQQDVVKVVDFGIARLADHAGATLTQTGAVVGTPGYVAPELFDGAAPSAASDLYAVGVVAYELLAGVAPFPGGTPREILKAVLFGEPPPLRAFVRDVPAPLEGLVMGLLEKDPAKRPGSARAVEAALSALQGSASSSSPSPPSSSASPSSSSSPSSPSSPSSAPATSVQVFGTETMLPPTPDTGERRPVAPSTGEAGLARAPAAIAATPATGTMTAGPMTAGPMTAGAHASVVGPSTSKPKAKGSGVPGWVIALGVVVGGGMLGVPLVVAAIADTLPGSFTVNVGPEDLPGLLGTSPAPIADNGEPYQLHPESIENLRAAGPEARAALLENARATLANPDLAADERAVAGALIGLIESTDWSSTSPSSASPSKDPAAIMARAERLLGSASGGAGRVDPAALARQGIGTRTNASLRREAELALQAHDSLRAERTLEQLLLQNPDDVEGLRMLANVYASTGRDDEARALRLRFLQLAPQHPKADAVRLLLGVPGVTD
jgi:hypothetical protein